jgi:hypothetical protein
VIKQNDTVTKVTLSKGLTECQGAIFIWWRLNREIFSFRLKCRALPGLLPATQITRVSYESDTKMASTFAPYTYYPAST